MNLNSTYYYFLFFLLLVTNLSTEGSCQEFSRGYEESFTKNGYPDGFLWGVDYGNGFIKNGNRSLRMSLDWMPSRWGFHLGATKMEASWGSIKTSASPEALEDPTTNMNSNAQILLPRTDKSVFDLSVIEVGLSFTSRYARKSTDWLMQTQMGVLLGDVSDTEKTTSFSSRGFFTEAGLLMNLGNDKKNWFKGSISLNGLRAVSQRDEPLTEEEKSLYFQFYQIHLGYYYRFF